MNRTLEANVAHPASGTVLEATPSPTEPPFSTAEEPRWQTPLIAFLLAAFTLLLYAPSLRNGFVSLDDPLYVTDNPLINQGLVWSHVVRTFNTIITGEWHPLALLSHMADVQMFGQHAAGHHFVSALWHAFNVMLLFLLLKAATGFTERSAAVAGLFAAFPLSVETVAWTSERKSLLSTAFLFLAIAAYGWYVRRPGIFRYLWIVLFFVLGLMSKAMIITLPCALLLLDYWPFKRLDLPGRRTPMDAAWTRRALTLVAEKIPLFALSVLCARITTRGMEKYGAVVSVDFYPLQWRVKNTIFSYLLYILKGLWPTHLAVFYPYQAATLPMWKVVGAGVTLVAITAAVWYFRDKRFLVAGWFWYVGILVPVIGIVQVGHQALADRYAYVPFIGLFVILVWLGSELADRVNLSQVTRYALTLALICGYAVTTYAQIGYWHDTYALWSHAAQVTSQNAFAEENLAQMLIEKGRPDLAEQHFLKATGYLPRWPVAHFDFALLLQNENRLPGAVREYQLALAYETEPDEASAAHINLGAIYIKQNQLAAALAEFNAAIAIKQDNWLSFLNRGLVEYTQGNLDAATRDFQQAVKVTPTPKDYFWLGRAMEDKGELNEAAAAFETALRMEPALTDAQTHLTAIRAKLH